MSEGIKAREGEEVWVNTLGGRLWYTIWDVNNRPQVRHARAGQRFRLSTDDREMNSSQISDPALDPFLNGNAKRVDERAADEVPEDYQADQALEDKDLMLLLAKSGNAFQSAVKKLNEKNARRLKDIVEAQDSTATVSQLNFVQTFVAETYKHGGQTSTGKELMADPS